MDFILFGGRDLQRFSLVIEAPPGASLDETTRILSELEERALEVAGASDEIKHVRMRAGMTQQGVQGLVVASNVGEIAVELIPFSERKRMGQAVKNEYREKVIDVPGARTMSFEDTRDGPPVGKAIQVRVRGDNLDTLQKIAAQIKEYLGTIDGVSEIMDNFPPGKDEVRPVLDLERLAAAGLDVRTVAQEIRGAFDGIKASTVHDGDEEIDIVVKYAEPFRGSIADVGEMHFATPAGMVPFGNLGGIERATGVASISHYNRKRTINVLADVDTDIITSSEANRLLMEKFDEIPFLYPGYTLEFGGEFEDIQESLDAMVRAFTITIILIYVILGGLFASFVQPLIVMFAVPFSFIGAILGLYIINEPLGMFAIIGIIALSGIVVNDSLILIDFINNRRREGAGLRHSIIHAGAARLRPILLTSITTIAGLLPMATGLFGGDPFLRPMALSIVWGLVFATALTLVVIPCVYAIADDMTIFVARRPLGLTRAEWNERQARRKKAEPRPPANSDPAS
jgi:multidrug efflux pump subunit AcrB